MTNPSALYLPGTSGNYVSTPDDASLDITGDLCLVAHVALDDWTPAADVVLLSKWNTSSNRSYALGVDTTGVLQLLTSSDGTAESTAQSTAAPTVSDGVDIWVAVTADVDNGASDADVKFWTSANGSSWSQLGSTVNPGAALTVYSSTATVNIGGHTAGTAGLWAGEVHVARIYSGVGAHSAAAQGTLVAEFRADAPVKPRYRDSTGKIWTFNGSAYSWVEVA